MTGRFVRSPRARGDLDKIWDYTVKRWGFDQAEIYTREIEKHIVAEVEKSLIGRTCPQIRAGYFKFPGGSHVLFYRRVNGGIDVVRILHERMDFGRHV